MIIVGSTSLGAKAAVEILDRLPTDVDIICTEEEFESFRASGDYADISVLKKHPHWKKGILMHKDTQRILEAEIAGENENSTSLLLDGLANDVRPVDLLYTMKMSHRFLKNSPHFHKTRRDILSLRKVAAKIFNEDWYKIRMEETYWYKHPNLSTSKEDFFADDGVTYYYDHDWLHEQLAIDNIPAYRTYLKDGSEVQCDKNKWNNCFFFTKLCGVAEEAAVLAYERSIIPFDTTREEMFPFALQKVCTSITSGWFREFAWENYDKVFKLMADIPEPYIKTGMSK